MENVNRCAETVEHLYDISKSTEEIDEIKFQELINVAIGIAAFPINQAEREEIRKIAFT